MKQKTWVGLGLLILLGLPCQASANAGTPLMWASALHLVFGNALIGIGEGLLLGLFFGLKKWRAIVVMIVANYASAWAGLYFLEAVLIPKLSIDLNNGWYWFWTLAVGAYLVTLLLEWPFVAFCFRGTPNWFKRSWWGNFTAQTVSYAVIFSWYWMASGTSLYTQMHVVPASEMKLPPIERIYYIGEQGKGVYTCDLRGNDKRWVRSVMVNGVLDRLFIRASASKPGKWDLMAVTKETGQHVREVVEVIPDFAQRVALEPRSGSEKETQYVPEAFRYGTVTAATLTNEHASNWEFQSGFWPIDGLTATNKKTRERVRFAYETIFGQWPVRNVTQLPTDQAVFQLGDNQICVFDPATKQVALIAHGHGPVVWFGK